jgi:leukotriene-A4 hydrolase
VDIKWILNSTLLGEQTLGGLQVFLPYVRDYVKTFSGKSIDTFQWKEHLYEYYRAHGGQEKIDALNTVNWDVMRLIFCVNFCTEWLSQGWFYGEGIELPVKLEYDTTLATKAQALAARWDEFRAIDVAKLGFSASDLDSFNSNQKSESRSVTCPSHIADALVVLLLEQLQDYPPFPSAHKSHLGEIYGFSTTGNAEIRFRFYVFALLNPSSPAAKEFAQEAARWVTGNDGTGLIKGRGKFSRPIFRSINKVDKDLAVTTFNKSKKAFHPIVRKMIEKVRLASWVVFNRGLTKA